MDEKNFSIANLLENDLHFLICLLLQDYGSLNLTQLTAILNQPKTTVHRTIKQLITLKFIQLDADRSLSDRGMFYCNSPQVTAVFEDSQRLSEENFDENTAEMASRMANLIKTVGILTQGLAKLYAQKVVEDPKMLKHNIFDDTGVGFVGIFNLALQNDENLREFRTLIMDFIFNKLTQFGSKKTETTHTMTFSVFPVKELFPKGVFSDS